MNRQNLVLLAVCISGLRLVGSSIVNQVLPIFFMVARVEENESWDLLFRTASEYYLQRFGINLATCVGAVFRDCTAGAGPAIAK